MQAKSVLGEKRGAVRHWYATVIRGEVSDATIQGYLLAASQIEDLWKQIDERLAALLAQGVRCLSSGAACSLRLLHGIFAVDPLCCTRGREMEGR